MPLIWKRRRLGVPATELYQLVNSALLVAAEPWIQAGLPSTLNSGPVAVKLWRYFPKSPPPLEKLPLTPLPPATWTRLNVTYCSSDALLAFEIVAIVVRRHRSFLYSSVGLRPQAF